MITEDYISFETAKLLKEKGFDELTSHYYIEEHLLKHYSPLANSDTAGISAPTHQMAMKWVREVHKIVISIFPTIETDVIVREDYNYTIYKNRTAIYQNCSLTYEQACESAIKYCLENLI